MADDESANPAAAAAKAFQPNGQDMFLGLGGGDGSSGGAGDDDFFDFMNPQPAMTAATGWPWGLPYEVDFLYTGVPLPSPSFSTSYQIPNLLETASSLGDLPSTDFFAPSEYQQQQQQQQRHQGQQAMTLTGPSSNDQSFVNPQRSQPQLVVDTTAGPYMQEIDMASRSAIARKHALPLSASSTYSSEDRQQKRVRKCEGGFPCQDENCDRVFDRAGDARKHYQRTHIPEAERKWGCPKCARRFNWKKDVERHDRRMHAGQQTSLALMSPPRRHLHINLPMLFASSNHTTLHSFRELTGHLWAAFLARKLVVRVRARRQSQSELTSKRFIMVTRDGRDFRAINVTDASNPQDLADIVSRELELPCPNDLRLSIYHLGQGVIGGQLDSEKLFASLSSPASGSAPLHFFQRPC